MKTSASKDRIRTAGVRALRVLCGSMSLLTANAGGAPDQTWPAQSVRFSVRAEASAGALRGVGPLWGRGWLVPGGTGDSDKTHSPRWFGGGAVHAYGWTPLGFRVVPVSDGWATLSFEAPPVETEGGQTFQGAVALAEVEVEGTTLLNGRFHIQPDGSPVHWSWQNHDGHPPQSGSPNGLGKRHVHIPRGTRLEQRIPLTAGQAVTVRFQARAVLPDGAQPMLPRRDSPSPAHVAVRAFRRGVNLGNYLEAPPNEDWGGSYSASDFDAIRSEGFDHVRIPVAWHHHLGPAPERRVSEAFFERVDRLAGLALERDLAVLLNWHHYDAFMQAPDRHVDNLEQVWRQIAARYADRPGIIAFEIMNEPHGRADTFTMNRIYARLIPVIRSLAPDRPLFVGPGHYQHIEELRRLRLPPDDNLIVSVHHYEPFLFTHQGASWTHPLNATTGIRFPGPPAQPLMPDAEAVRAHPWISAWVRAHNELPPDLNPSSVEALTGLIRWARDWSDFHGFPIHIGEWGAVKWSDPASRIRYHREMRRRMDQWDIPWTLWDWNQNFRYWDSGNGAPVEGMRDALF